MMQLERWSLLIIRESMLRGVTRFNDFQVSLGVAPDLLAIRLDELVSAGVLEVSPTSDYLLTPKGWDLEPTISALSSWSEKWTEATAPGRALRTTAAWPIARTPVIPSPHDLPVDDIVLPGTVETTAEATEEAARPAATTGPLAASATPAVAIEISLLGSFLLCVGGEPVGPLSVGSQRLLVFLALNDRHVGRAAMAGRMWPEVSNERAGISLRSALSRLDAPTREAILTASAGLRLAETVVVDLRNAQALAYRLLDNSGSVRITDLSPASLTALSSELLPDWYDDWVIAEAEDWRQLRMNALEALADQLILIGRLADAAGAARAAMKVEPLRESAHATLIRVHLAEGNQSEALRVYERYSALLQLALGLTPTDRLSALVEPISKR
jgi:DNA-binding SARP family transcriptional activator/DNA-binding HxlR family transcriptional regulator